MASGRGCVRATQPQHSTLTLPFTTTLTSPPFHIAGAMANDPRARSMNNAMLSFQKPAKEKTGKMRELAPSLPVLVATRDIGIGEEVFYSYGSEKPVRAYPRDRDQTFRCLLASLLSPRAPVFDDLSLCVQFEHIRKHLQEEREKEQKEKGIRGSVKLVWVLHADRDRDKEESEDEDDEEVCVCSTQARSKPANQQASQPAAPLTHPFPLPSHCLSGGRKEEALEGCEGEGEGAGGAAEAAAKQLHDLCE